MSEQISSENESKIGFFIENNSRIKLILPKFLQKATSTREVNEIVQFYNVLKKYQKENNFQLTIQEEGFFNTSREGFYQQNKYEFSVIELYFSLIEDYIENGLLFFRKRNINNKPKGSINWNKTIQSSAEIISSNTILYREFYFNNIKNNIEHPVTLLHVLTLLKISSTLNIKINLPIELTYLKKSKTNQDIRLIRTLLKKYKGEMFSDRERKIFSILEQLYLEVNKIRFITKNGPHLVYAEKFDFIWERMLKVALFDEYYNLKKEIPNGKYQLIENEDAEPTIFNGMAPRPDILIREQYSSNDYLLILDAKNYVPDYINKKGMPGTKDIIKQIFYKFLFSRQFNINNKYSCENIVNAFLFPTVLDDGSIIKFMGKHRFDDPFYNKNSIGNILCFKVDFNELRKHYLYPNRKYKEQITKYILTTFVNLE
nr:LlaJI family restriction endonuclease [Neobacillus sp. Marseille-Q6967]